MKVYTNKTLDNGVFNVNMITADFSADELRAMEILGEPEIDAGGVFDLDGANEFTLPNNLVRLKSGSPFIQGFDKRDHAAPTEAQIWADIWATEMLARIKASVDTLRAATDTFTNESMITY